MPKQMTAAIDVINEGIKWSLELQRQRDILLDAVVLIVEKAEDWQSGGVPEGCAEVPYWNLGDIGRAALCRIEDSANNDE